MAYLLTVVVKFTVLNKCRMLFQRFFFEFQIKSEVGQFNVSSCIYFGLI